MNFCYGQNEKKAFNSPQIIIDQALIRYSIEKENLPVYQVL